MIKLEIPINDEEKRSGWSSYNTRKKKQIGAIIRQWFFYFPFVYFTSYYHNKCKELDSLYQGGVVNGSKVWVMILPSLGFVWIFF